MSQILEFAETASEKPEAVAAEQPKASVFAIKLETIGASEEFSYTPITPFAPIGLFFAICSVTAYFGWYGVFLGGLGVLFGLLAAAKISSGAYSGKVLAWFATLLSTATFIGGSAWHSYVYATEVPEGHQRVNFSWLSEQKPIVSQGKSEIHPDVKKLDGQKIFIKGYMYPTNRQQGIKEFVLVKDTGQCCFGGQPKLTDMVVVQFKDLAVDHRELELVSVAGTFHAGETIQSGELTSIYTLEGTHFQ